MLKACSSSSLRSDRSPTVPVGSRPELAVTNSVEQGSVIPIRHRHPRYRCLLREFPRISGDGGAGGRLNDVNRRKWP